MQTSQALLYAALGYLTVFIGIALLFTIIVITSQFFKKKTVVEEVEPQPEIPKKMAPGTAGEIELNNVSERDAAMVMAIVAYKLNKPLNQLRFKSIKEVEQ